MCLYTCTFVVTCLYPPRLIHTLTPPPYAPRQLLPHTWPHPAHPHRARRKKTVPRRGTIFPPCGGQSLWICQSNSGPSSLGSRAQQAHSAPPVDGGLWNELPDSRLWRCAFVRQLQGGIDDWLHLCFRNRATPETLDLQWSELSQVQQKTPCCVRK